MRLDPFRTYFIEVLGKNRGFDVMGRDTYPGDLTLELPGIAAVWDDGRHLWIQGSETPLHNQFDLISGATPSGWHEIEVRGYGGTGTYQIKVRVNNICIDTNGYEQYPYFGGPDGYMLDVPGDETTRPGLMDTYSLSWRSVTGFLGDNWSWYREGEPDVDWVRVYLKANQEYTAELWTEDIYPLEHQATDLKILGVHDSNGDLIAGTPSSNSGKKVATTFQPATDGEYYLAVGSGNRDRTGTYSISIQGRTPGESANRLRSVSSDDRETKGEDSTEVGRDTKLDDSTTNSPVTGAPSISGTAKVGETLSADTSTIRDADGLRKAVFTYQWTADGSEITGATAVSYTVVVRDEGKAIRVKVFFTDDAGNREAVTSYATSPVTAQTDGKLAVSVSRIDDTDGLNDAYQRLAYGVEVSHGGALALSSESRGRSFNFLGTTGSPVLFDIKYSGTDEFKMLVVDSEEYGGRYERLLTPRRLSGPYEGVRALVYKGGEFEDQEEAAGAFNVRVEGDGAWELKIRLPDFGVPPVTMAKGIGDDVVGPWDLRSPNPFVADFHFAITHEGREFSARLISSDGTVSTLVPYQNTAFTDRTATVNVFAPWNPHKGASDLGYDDYVLEIQADGEWSVRLINPAPEPAQRQQSVPLERVLGTYMGFGHEELLHSIAGANVPNSPILFDIDFRGGSAFDVALENTIAQYARHLTPPATVGAYQGILALPYKDGELDGELVPWFNVVVEALGPWKVKIGLPDFSAPAITSANGSGDNVIGPFVLRSEQPFTDNFYFEVTHAGANFEARLIASDGTSRYLIPPQHIPFEDRRAPLTLYSPGVLDGDTDELFYGEFVLAIEADGEWTVKLIGEASEEASEKEDPVDG